MRKQSGLPRCLFRHRDGRIRVQVRRHSVGCFGTIEEAEAALTRWRQDNPYQRMNKNTGLPIGISLTPGGRFRVMIRDPATMRLVCCGTWSTVPEAEAALARWRQDNPHQRMNKNTGLPACISLTPGGRYRVMIPDPNQTKPPKPGLEAYVPIKFFVKPQEQQHVRTSKQPRYPRGFKESEFAQQLHWLLTNFEPHLFVAPDA